MIKSPMKKTMIPIWDRNPLSLRKKWERYLITKIISNTRGRKAADIRAAFSAIYGIQENQPSKEKKALLNYNLFWERNFSMIIIIQKIILTEKNYRVTQHGQFPDHRFWTILNETKSTKESQD